MKQILFLLLFPCLAMAQYQGNGNQKITLGEQSTADGLVYRGIRADTTSKIVPFSDTSAYIILDTVEKTLWLYKAGQIPKWQQVGGSAGGSTIDTASMLTNYYRAGRSGIIQAADVPTLNQNTTGSAATLTTARNIRTNLASAFGANFNGSADITPGVSGILGAGNGGTGASNFGSPNRIPFVSSSGSLTTDTFFAYNGTTQRLGVGVPNPTEKLHVSGNGLFTGSMSLGTPLTGANGGTGLTTFGAAGNIPYASSTTALKTSNRFNITEVGAAPYLEIDGAIRLQNASPFAFYNQNNDYLFSFSVASNSRIWLLQNNIGSDVFIARGPEKRLGIAYNFADSASVTEALTVNGSAKITLVGALGGNSATLYRNSDGVLSTTSSDINKKHNVRPIIYGLSTINQLNPVNFQWNVDESEDIGFIAQDIQNIIPESIETDWDSNLIFKYEKLIPILTKAIQEQQALIKALEQRILILENK